MLHNRVAEGRDWWKNAVVYEIYPRSFQDSNGDGIGDLNGVTSRLDYLRDLGVDAIWLTPSYPSPQIDFGYDISDYEQIDPQYGTLADFDRLIAEANKRHIRVIMDMVMNHSSDRHQWFQQSRSSRDNPYRNWYIWHDAKGWDAAGHPIPPNNWLSIFGHSAWTWDERTRQFYYHKFYAQQPDLNWNNPHVHQAFQNIITFWIRHGVAGFRFDAIGMLYEDAALADEPYKRTPNGRIVINAYGDQQTDGSKTENLSGTHAVMQELRALTDRLSSDDFPGTCVLIGEVNAPTMQELNALYGSVEHPEFHLPMDSQSGAIDRFDAAPFRAHLRDLETSLVVNTPLLLSDNHDHPRMDMRYGDGLHDMEIQRVMATVLLASRGSVLMYYGDEIGMKTTQPVRREDVKDPIGLLGWPKEKGRDGERTPMQWTAGAMAGFTQGRQPWLPVPASASVINVEREAQQPDSLLNWYKRLIHLKKTNRALAQGGDEIFDTGKAQVLAWMRIAPGENPVVVLANFSAQPQPVNLRSQVPSSASLHTLLKTPGVADGVNPAQVELEPFGVYIGEIEADGRSQ